MVESGRQPIVLVSEHINSPRYFLSEDASAVEPRLDYREIARKVDGEIYGLDESALGGLTLRFERMLKLDLSEALLAYSRIGNSNLILSTSEKTGLPMAALWALSRQDNPHVLISHHISSPNKKRLFSIWPLYRSFSKIIFVSRSQARYATEILGLPQDRVKFTFDKVDHHFFAPQNRTPEDFILSVGNEERDYSTLISALSGSNIRLVIVASSPWSKFRSDSSPKANVTILDRITYLELRELYARARMVVLPLNDVDFAAGANAALEAMAMAKPLILLDSHGLEGYVSHDQTGWILPGKNPAALREAILMLWDDSASRARLGANARQAVLDQMNMQIYTEKIAETVQGCLIEFNLEISKAASMVNVHR